MNNEFYAGTDVQARVYHVDENDFKQIASWGCDHVRIPFDWDEFADFSKDNPYTEQGFERIDNIVKMCENSKLNIILCSSSAPGFNPFLNPNDERFFNNRVMQLQFLDFWKQLAIRYKDNRGIAFELQNETLADTGCKSGSDKWNRIWHECVNVIRFYDKNRIIIVGGNYFNSINKLDDIDVIDDNNVWYNFHCYFPMMFTHQRIDNPKYLNQVKWPFYSIEHAEFFGGKDNIGEDLQGYVCIDHIREEFKPVKDFISKTGKKLICTEYGVCQYADMQSKLNWFKDFLTVMDEYGIGRTVYDYTSFTELVDIKTRKPNSEELIKLISKKPHVNA